MNAYLTESGNPRARAPEGWLRAGLAGGAALLLSASPSFLGAQDMEAISEGIAVAADTYVRVHLAGDGLVRVVGWDRDSLHVSGSRTAGVGRFSVDGDGGSAKLVYAPDDDGGVGRAEIEVRLPASATVWMKLTGASVAISGVKGGLDVYTLKGDVQVSGSPSELSAESMGGGVDLTGTYPAVKAKTGSGPITFRGESDDVTLVTVSGRITVTGPHLKRGHFESVKGDIVFDGALAKGSSVTFKNHHGNVELRLPEQTGAEFSVTTWEGELTSEFETSVSEADEAKGGRQSVFTIGKPQASVEIQNFGGAVILKRQ